MTSYYGLPPPSPTSSELIRDEEELEKELNPEQEQDMEYEEGPPSDEAVPAAEDDDLEYRWAGGLLSPPCTTLAR
eukprot:6003547-Prymnesium_polylepis.1